MVQRGLAALFLLGLALLASLSLTSFLGWWTQPFEILSHFRPHYTIALCVIGLGLWALKQNLAAIAALALITLNVLAIAPSSMSPPRATDTPHTTLIWANLLRQQSSLLAIADLVSAEAADIVALTELPPGGEAAVRAALPAMQCFTTIAGEQDTFSVLIAARQPCAASGQIDEFERPSDAVWADIEGVRVIATHPRPPINNEATAERDALIRAAMSRAAGRDRTVFVGDFNATPWSHIGGEVRRQGFRRAHCDGPLAPTWRSRNLLFGLAIDHAYVSPDVRVRSCAIGPSIGSDHWPLILEFDASVR